MTEIPEDRGPPFSAWSHNPYSGLSGDLPCEKNPYDRPAVPVVLSVDLGGYELTDREKWTKMSGVSFSQQINAGWSISLSNLSLEESVITDAFKSHNRYLKVTFGLSGHGTRTIWSELRGFARESMSSDLFSVQAGMPIAMNRYPFSGQWESGTRASDIVKEIAEFYDWAYIIEETEKLDVFLRAKNVNPISWIISKFCYPIPELRVQSSANGREDFVVYLEPTSNARPILHFHSRTYRAPTASFEETWEFQAGFIEDGTGIWVPESTLPLDEEIRDNIWHPAGFSGDAHDMPEDADEDAEEYWTRGAWEDAHWEEDAVIQEAAPEDAEPTVVPAHWIQSNWIADHYHYKGNMRSFQKHLNGTQFTDAIVGRARNDALEEGEAPPSFGSSLIGETHKFAEAPHDYSDYFYDTASFGMWYPNVNLQLLTRASIKYSSPAVSENAEYSIYGLSFSVGGGGVSMTANACGLKEKF